MHLEKNIFHDKNVLVTGAGSGIGRSVAKLFGYAGARVALLGRTEEPLVRTAKKSGEHPERHLVLTADVSDEEAMEQAFARIAEEWGSLDVVVANAGVNGVWAPLDDLKVADWDKTLSINLRGTFLTVKGALPLMRKRGSSVVVISSVNGTRMFSNSGATAYACSKAGQVAFVKMTALELASRGIRVNAVCPGAIETDIEDNTERRDLDEAGVKVKYPEGAVPLTGGSPGTSGQVAQAVWFLASEAASHITGTEIYVDGAQSLIQG